MGEISELGRILGESSVTERLQRCGLEALRTAESERKKNKIK
jgi:hypothetical protein